MDATTKSTGSLVELFHHAPSFLALLAGVAYASGFLCVHTFLDAFGVREGEVDLFKARSIHVGILFLLFPISVLLPLYVAASLRHIQNQTSTTPPEPQTQPDTTILDHNSNMVKQRIPTPSFLLYLNMGWIFYAYILFAPRNFVARTDKQLVIPLIFVASVFGPRLIERIDPGAEKRYGRGLRWFLFFLIIVPLDYLALRGLLRHIGSLIWGNSGILPNGAVYYFLFMLLIPYTLSRANDRAKLMPTEQGKAAVRLSGLGLCFILYFLAIIAFSIRVYPFIPAGKGGGDYSDSPIMMCTVRPASVSTNAYPDLLPPNRFVVIDETVASLFLANITNEGGPSMWRHLEYLPRIIEIRREAIDPIIYYSPETPTPATKH